MNTLRVVYFLRREFAMTTPAALRTTAPATNAAIPFRVRSFAAGLVAFQLFFASSAPAVMAAAVPAFAPATTADFVTLPTRAVASRPRVMTFFADFFIELMMTP
jgi:hypothetical protein